MGAKPEKILGLDISSVCVGWALFQECELDQYDKYLQEGKDHGERMLNFARWLEHMFTTHKPDHVVIELPHGGGRGRTFKVLTQYSAIVFMMHFKLYKKELNDSHCLYPISVKKLLKLPTANNHDENKRIMVEHINTVFRLSLRCNPTDKTKKTTDDDIADAIGLVVAWLVRSNRDDGRFDPEPNRRRKRAKKATPR